MFPDAGVLRPVARAPLSVLVSRQLRDAIVSGTLGVGTEWPSEKQLTQHFGVSRSTIREALRILQAQGLLSGGDTVSTARPQVSVELTIAAATDALENVLRLGLVPLTDLIDLRLVIEGAALETAGSGAEGLSEARRELEAMRQPGISISAFHAADVRFHISLATASGNSAVPLVMNVLRHAIAAHLLTTLEAMDESGPTLARLTAEHARILESVEAGDVARARTLLRSHVKRFYAHDAASRP